MSGHHSNNNPRPPENTARCEMIALEPANLRVSVRLTDTLIAYGLGACVCACLYDYTLKVAGMANIALPDSAASGMTEAVCEKYTGRYADTALSLLLEEMRRAGVATCNVRAAIVGGSHVLGAPKGAILPDCLQIGRRNINAVTAFLNDRGIPILGKEIGGSQGRTVVLRACDGSVIVKKSASDAHVVARLNTSESKLAA